MKKFCLLLSAFICLCSLGVFADSYIDFEDDIIGDSNCNKPCQQAVQPKCPQEEMSNFSDCFLCTNKDMQTLFREIGLSETQICTAMKIQDKYEHEVLSLNDRIEYEESSLASLNESCSSGSEIRKEKRKIKDLKNKRKEICDCYEKQFKALLSDEQKRAYNKYKRSK